MMKDNDYALSFNRFITATKEKEKLLFEIMNVIGLKKNFTFLDIGAGDGSLTFPIAKSAKKTTVIEPNKTFANHFIQAEIDCYIKRWEEVLIDDKFDLILASHVIAQFSQKSMFLMIKKMLSCLTRQGKLIIITADDQYGSLRKVQLAFYDHIGCSQQRTLGQINRWLQENSSAIKVIDINFKSDTVETMLETIAFPFLHWGNLFYENRVFLIEKLKQYQNQTLVELNYRQHIYILDLDCINFIYDE